MTVPALVFSARLNDKSGAAFAALKQKIEQVRGSAKTTATDLGKLSGSLKSFGAGLGIGILSADLLSLPGIVRDTIAEASTLAKTADLIGVTTDQLQELTFGFGLAGVETSKTEDALKQFGRRLAEAETKGGMLADILALNGVALRDTQGRIRPVLDLLRDYADLIKGAASEQERLSLANEAFGEAGATLVLALRNGASGVDDLNREVYRAGGILDEELLRRAEVLDDQFARMWRTFELNGKSAILTVADALADATDSMESALGRLGNADVFKDFSAFLDRYGLLDREAIFSGTVRLNGGFEALAKAQQGQVFNAADLGFGRAGPLEITVTPTTRLPKRRETASAAGARDRKAEISDYQRVLEQLTRERALIGLAAEDQQKLNLLRRAGVDATSEQGRAISALIEEIDRQEAAQARVNETTFFLGSVASSQIGEFINLLGFADDAAGRLASSLAEAALKAALLGEGPLATVFGTNRGGGFLGMLVSGVGASFGKGAGSGIASAFAGMYADGGTLGAGQWGIAGENGPEPVVGPAKVVSNRDAFGANGRQLVVNVTIQTPNPESFRRSRTQIEATIADAVSRGRRGR